MPCQSWSQLWSLALEKARFLTLTCNSPFDFIFTDQPLSLMLIWTLLAELTAHSVPTFPNSALQDYWFFNTTLFTISRIYEVLARRNLLFMKGIALRCLEFVQFQGDSPAARRPLGTSYFLHFLCLKPTSNSQVLLSLVISIAKEGVAEEVLGMWAQAGFPIVYIFSFQIYDYWSNFCVFGHNSVIFYSSFRGYFWMGRDSVWFYFLAMTLIFSSPTWISW